MALIISMTDISPVVQDWIDQFKEKVRILLIPPDDLSIYDSQDILRRYDAAVEGNFLAWMGATIVCARHPLGRFAAEENMWVEITEDHPTMLREFVQSAARSLPSQDDFAAVSGAVLHIRRLVSGLIGAQCLALMAMLESGSIIFSPYLGQLAKRLGSDNLQYAEVHGEADQDHSSRFLAALSFELEYGGYESPQDSWLAIYEMENAVLVWLKTIFNPTQE